MESNGMFDKYMKEDKQTADGVRDLESYESTEDAELQVEDKAEPMGMPHMEMMHQIMHLLEAVMGLFSTMMKSGPKHKAESNEDE